MSKTAINLVEWQEDIRGDQHKITAMEIEDHWMIIKLSKRYSIDEWTVDSTWKAMELPVVSDPNE